MIHLEINNPELEKTIQQTFGNDQESLVLAFTEFLHKKKIQKDIQVSIQQIEQKKVLTLERTFEQVRSRYE